MRHFLVAEVVVLALAGCGGPALRAGNLPPELRIVPRAASGPVHLAGIASPGDDESRIAPGDLLKLSLSSGRDDEAPAPVLTRVSAAGAADVPLVGPVQIGGLDPFQASQAVAAAAVSRGIYRRPHVTLEIEDKAVNRVTVMGAVTTPGVHELPRSSSDLVKALAVAGGLTEDAGSVVEIIRQTSPVPAAPAMYSPAADDSLLDHGVGQASFQPAVALPPQVIHVDLASAAPAVGDYRLGDQDVVMVTPRDKEMVYVTGLVNKPGQFELPVNTEVRLLDAIAMGGGLSSAVADKVLVIRRAPGRPEPIAIQASLRAAKHDGAENLVLGAGDVVSVEQTPATAIVDTMMRLIRFSIGLAGRTTLF